MLSPEGRQEVPFKARATIVGRMFQEAIMHPLTYSEISYDADANSVRVERFEETPEEKKVSPSLRLKLVGALMKESMLHPLVVSRFTIDKDNNRIIVERDKVKPHKGK